MQIETTRFGTVAIEVDDILLFPQGLVGFEKCRHWVLLADDDNESLGWLQCVNHAEVALPVISPRRFLPDYKVRLQRGQILPLELTQFDQAFVLTIVGRGDDELTVNLKAPLILNLDRRLGRQVVTSDEQPISLPILDRTVAPLRKSA